MSFRSTRFHCLFRSISSMFPAIVSTAGQLYEPTRLSRCHSRQSSDIVRVMSGALTTPFHFSSPRTKSPRRTSSRVLSTASAALDACPRCGESPYGLMINCSGCGRQCHSSCVPEGQRVRKGLGAVFQCSKCTSSS